ncbi:MAG TPA: hypothetical protein VMS08_03410 [Candidatus Saccharimonadia bacterium]|nr:hypothetical protein [Candidatus Saccharimonadia bacterium]
MTTALTTTSFTKQHDQVAKGLKKRAIDLLRAQEAILSAYEIGTGYKEEHETVRITLGNLTLHVRLVTNQPS